MSSFPPTGIDYHGSTTVDLEDPGEVDIDERGIASCTARYRTPAANWQNLPKHRSAHPIFRGLSATRRRIKLSGPYAYCEATYEGFDPLGGGGSAEVLGPPTYELVRGVSDDPIETHDRFDSVIGGTPKNPLNGANFRNISDGTIANAAKKASTDEGYVFDSFSIILPNGKKNPFAKIEAYYNASKCTWRKSWLSRARPSSNVRAGKIDTPDGNPPAINGDWLNMGITSVERGSIFSNTEDWLGSGPGGWNKIIYRR